MSKSRIVGAACGLALLLSPLPGPAEAKVADSAWASCVWAKAPLSAEKWLSMPLPNWDTSFSESNLLLGHLLIATCDESEANKLKPNHSPDWKAMAGALKRSRPATLPPPAPAGPQAATILLCQSTVTGEAPPYVYLAEVVRRLGAKDRTNFQQYFLSVGGKAARIPQDMRMQPGPKDRVDRACRRIGPEGELADAQ